ncbi:hemerythrin domain-containing protein [Streptomyces filamentosus]|uniref:hemerythrin domain-containing protein n=1 Tax=Streptomyces filamentosus TaxID=67294 RepID=UPI0036E43CBB
MLLREGHKTVEKLFKRFEKTDDDEAAERRRIADEVIEELTVHAWIEEKIFYPAAREAAPDTKDHVLESIEEHHAVVWMLSETKDMDPGDERFKAKMTVLIEQVRHHVEEEEQDWFPDVRKAMGLVWPARRQAAVCTRRSRAGTMTRIRPWGEKSRAAAAAGRSCRSRSPRRTGRVHRRAGGSRCGAGWSMRGSRPGPPSGACVAERRSRSVVSVPGAEGVGQGGGSRRAGPAGGPAWCGSVAGGGGRQAGALPSAHRSNSMCATLSMWTFSRLAARVPRCWK